MDETKYDLNAPAFGPGAQTLDNVSAETPVAPVSTEEPKAEEVTATPSDEEEEEKRVTYSRFKNVWNRAKEAEEAAEKAHQEAEEWRLKAETARSNEPEPAGESLPSWWQELYGDSDASQKAWKIQHEANEQLANRIRTETREEALEAVRNEKVSEDLRVKENVQLIDEQLEQLTDYTGRKLSDDEQVAVLDIVDEFSPKDEDGNFLGAPIPFEKAWDIYELKQKATNAPKRQSRDAVAAITGSSSQGDPVVESEKDKTFNPLDWNAWKSRI